MNKELTIETMLESLNKLINKIQKQAYEMEGAMYDCQQGKDNVSEEVKIFWKEYYDILTKHSIYTDICLEEYEKLFNKWRDKYNGNNN